MSVQATDREFQMLNAVVRQFLGFNLENYKSRQLDRRLTFFQQKNGFSGLGELAASLRRDSEMRSRFSDFLTINVSEFYRNPERFKALGEYLPQLLKGKRQLRIWSAGCSIGAEIYTVALMLEQLTPGRRHDLLATDIDQGSLKRARAAIYQPSEIKDVPAQIKKYFFTETSTGWQLDAAISTRVKFRRHDLLNDPFPDDLDMIICRNVVIYFTAPVKAELYRKFSAALRPDGLLFIGATESIFDARNCGLRYLQPCFYRKPEEGAL